MRLNAGKLPLKSLSEMSNVRRMVLRCYRCTQYNETHWTMFHTPRARFIQEPRKLSFREKFKIISKVNAQNQKQKYTKQLLRAPFAEKYC